MYPGERSTKPVPAHLYIGVAVSQAKNYYHNTINMCNWTNLKMSVEAAASAAEKAAWYGALKDLQLEHFKGIATGRAVFTVLPTGYDKKLNEATLSRWIAHVRGVLVHLLKTNFGFWASISPSSNAQNCSCACVLYIDHS